MCWYIRNKHLSFLLLRWNTTGFWKVYVERERSSITHLILIESLLYKKCIYFSRLDQITSKINDDEWKNVSNGGTKHQTKKYSSFCLIPKRSLPYLFAVFVFWATIYFFKLKLDSRKSFSSISFNTKCVILYKHAEWSKYWPWVSTNAFYIWCSSINW